MIAWLRSLLPNHTTPEMIARGSLVVIRERILQTLLIGLLSLALPVVIISIQLVLRVNKYGLAVFYIVLLLALVLVTTNRRWPYGFRSMAVISLIFLLAISEFFDSSLPGEFRFYLTIVASLAALLLGSRAGFAAVFICFATHFFIGMAVSNGAIVLDKPDLFINSPNWMNSSFVFLLLEGGVVASISTMIAGLQSGLREKENLSNTLEKQRQILEETVQNRTSDMQRRLIQVRTAAEISRAISRLNDPNTIYRQVTNLVKEGFNLYYVGIFLIEPSGRYAVLEAGTGEAGRIMLEQNHRLAIGGNSMIGWCTVNRQPRIALDIGEEAVRFNNPYLPNTRSEAALPILSQSEVLGAITVQSELARAFDQNDIMVLQGIADSLAVAIENSRLISELKENLEEIQTLNRSYVKNAWSAILEESGDLQATYEDALPNAPAEPLKQVSIPLVLRDQVIGYLNLEMEHDQLSDEDQAYIDTVTTQTAMALENARLMQESEWRVFQERKLNEMSAEFYKASNLDGILRTAAVQIGQLPLVTEVSIQLITPERQADQKNAKEKLG